MNEEDQKYDMWPMMTLLIVIVLCVTAVALAVILK